MVTHSFLATWVAGKARIRGVNNETCIFNKEIMALKMQGMCMEELYE